MTSLFVLVAASSLGIDYGWQPVADGGIEYIIRLEAEAIQDLQDGYDLSSDLPADLTQIKHLRLTTIEGAIPNEGVEPPRAEPLRYAGPAVSSRIGAASRLARPKSNTLLGRGGRTAADFAYLFHQGEKPPTFIDEIKIHSALGEELGASKAKGASKDDDEDADDENGEDDANESKKKPDKGRDSEISSPSDEATKATDEKPWYAFMTATMLLFVSVASNGYQYWIHSELRRRYQSALAGLLS